MKKEENDIQEAWSIGDARDEPEPLTRPEVISHARDPPRRLKPSKVSQRSEAESAAQPTNFWENQSVGGRSMGPLRATAIMGLSRDRVIEVCGGRELTDHGGSKFLPTSKLSVSGFLRRNFSS